ncbi:MAG: chloride channel protein [Hespellia sp.]|nr:chloride channel protein [Hespellia sp.]
MEKKRLNEGMSEQGKLFASMFKWIILATVSGAVIGACASMFAKGITWATEFRMANPFIVIGLPIGGAFIVWMYHFTKQGNNSGTNLMMKAVREGEYIPLRVAPLILISTIITHFFGGSSGREGAALQFGGSVGNFLGKTFHLNEDDTKIIILASMSAAFSTLFGTPLAAAIFPMEVISIGVMYYSALVPCVFASFVAQHISLMFHIRTIQTPYPVEDIPSFYGISGIKIMALAIACAFVGSLFCIMLRRTEGFYEANMENKYIRVAIGGFIVVIFSFVLQTQDYLGLGTQIIHSSFAEASRPEAFLLKLIFTCLTLCAGYKGGEIVPSLFIGATMGSAMSLLLGLPVELCAACGMVGVFCAVTNSPISSMLIAFELFGFEGMPYFCVVVAISYMLSGYYSLYSEQKIVYSKIRPRFINRNPNS